MSRNAVIMAGPLPPAVGGMASVIGALGESSLARRLDLQLFDTGKTTPEGRSLFQGIAARWRVMREWYRLVGQRPAPIVHIHTCSGLTYFLDGVLLLLARARRAPVVLHIHGAQFDQFLDGLRWPLSVLARWLARRAQCVIVLSEDWRLRMVARLPGARLEVVANGIPELAVAPEHRSNAGVRFLFLGNLGRRKGVDVLLQAAGMAREPWSVDLAGGEEEPGFRDWVVREVEQRALQQRVRLLGPVVGAAKTDLLLSADGFVLPSRAEGLPMALLEAMAARLPVVVTTVGAMPEVVQEGVQGCLVPPGDAPALAAALDRLAMVPDDRCRMGQAAWETFSRGYGIERMADALMGVYAGLSRVR